MKVEPCLYPGWGKYPSYRVTNYAQYRDVVAWMHDNAVDHFLLASGVSGYVFQVRTKHDWFVLRWA